MFVTIIYLKKILAWFFSFVFLFDLKFLEGLLHFFVAENGLETQMLIIAK